MPELVLDRHRLMVPIDHPDGSVTDEKLAEAYLRADQRGRILIPLRVTTTDVKKTVSYPVALSSVYTYAGGIWTQAGTQVGDTRANNFTTTSVDIGYPDAGSGPDSHVTETMGGVVIGDA